MNNDIKTTVVVSAMVVISYTTITSLPGNIRPIVTHVEQGYEEVSSSSIVSSIPSTKLGPTYNVVAEYVQNEVSPMNQSQALNYPNWVTRSFGASILGLSIGIASLMYVVMFGFSLIALGGVYLIPISLSIAYVLLSNFDTRPTISHDR
jgi:hypothetical protein